MIVQPGDVGFTREGGFPKPEWWIRFAERRKYGRDTGHDSPAHWNHCFLITNVAGDLLEATPQGIAANRLDEYNHVEVGMLRPAYDAPTLLSATIAWSQPAAVVSHMQAMQGQPYAWGSILSDAASLLFGFTLRIGFAKHHTCSGAVAHALSLSGVDMGDDEEWNSPADNWAILRKLGAVEIA